PVSHGQRVEEGDQESVHFPRLLLLYPVPAACDDLRTHQPGDELRQRVDDLSHAGNAEPRVAGPGEIQGGWLDLHPLEARQKLAVAIQVSIVVEATPESTRLEGGGDLSEDFFVQPGRQRRRQWKGREHPSFTGYHAEGVRRIVTSIARSR